MADAVFVIHRRVEQVVATGSGVGMTNPMTTAGDIIVGGSAGVPNRLAIGAAGKVLGVVAGSPAWVDPAGGGGGAVDSVNGQSGVVVLDAADVGADASGTATTAAAAAVAAHTVLADPHPQYLTPAEANVAYERVLTAGTNVTIDRTNPSAPVINASGGGGGGAVDSVNGKTGVVVLDTDDIAEGVSNLYFTNGRAAAAAPVQTVDGQTGAVSLSSSYAPLSHVGDGGAAHSNAVAAGAAGFMTGADKTKLDGIAAGATQNSSDAFLRARGNHTGTQTASTISDFAETVRATVLTGLSLASGAAITATDSALAAWGKLQKQINDLVAAVAGKQDTLVSGTNIKTVNGSTLLGSGNVAVAAAPAPVITDATTARTAALAEAGSYIRWTNTAAKAYTVPPQATVAWAADTELHGRNCAAGNLTLTPGAGVTLNAPYLGTLVVPPGGAYTLKRGTADVWDVLALTVAA